ncbi:Formate/nitrite transporter [Hortaea werneckii]|nr:Formate/nitrite transporter [Hortaea werneckii]
MSGFIPQQEDAYTPQQAMQLIARSGEKKCVMRLDKFIYNSIIAGPLLGFGCAASLIAGDSPWYSDNAPGVIHTLAGAVFPIGLILIALTGAELWTSTVFYTSVALFEGRASLLNVLKTWFLAFFANLGGILFFMYIICIYGGVFMAESAQEHCRTYAIRKAQSPGWHQIFLSAIGANWLVCLAVYQGILAREVVSKIIAIWWPIFIFVMLGMDHVIANMFLVPVGMYYGAPFGVGYYIWKSMIPAALGNIVGGCGFVGLSYWYMWMTSDEAVPAEFDKTWAEKDQHHHTREKSRFPHSSSPESSDGHNEFNARQV